MTVSPHDQARILSEALPHMQRYDEEIVVIKYGGHAMGEEDAAREFARDIVLLEQTAINPVVVHGGGPQIEAMLKRLGIKSEFAGGLRVTDAATIEVVEMVLAGSINKQIVGYINEAGGKAVGLCGKDGNMVIARKVEPHDGRSGFATSRTWSISASSANRTRSIVTVLNQIARPRADSGAGAGRRLAKTARPTTSTPTPSPARSPGALKAKRLLLLTDVAGVLDKSKKLIERIVGQRRAQADRRRHHFGRHDPEGRDLHRGAAIRASRASSSSTARCRTRCCSNCSPTTAPAR